MIRHPDIETNPIARKMMHRIGVKGTAWLVFAIVIIIVVVSGWGAILMSDFWKLCHIIYGIATSVMHVAVAQNNWTGQPNKITLMVFRLHSKMAKLKLKLK